MSPSVSQDPAKQAIWQIESTHPEKAKQVEEALREVMDPEIGLNVIELGLVRQIVFDEKENMANITMIMTTPFCPYAPVLLEMVRSKVEETLGVPTTIEMGMDMWDLSYMEEGAGAEWGLF
jgi:metal-sulfur cluster biosynthetic enzyme